MDIKRQQKEIEQLIKEKRKEMEKYKTLKKNFQLKYTKSIGKEQSKPEEIKFDR